MTRRITKDPQTRIAEILDTAEKMFADRGYQETQVSDIVKAIGVSQGTFYYYFKSKEEVVEALVQRKLNQIIVEFKDIQSSKEMTAPEKVVFIIHIILNNIQGQDGLAFEYLFEEQHLHIIDKLSRQSDNVLIPVMQNIVDEGIMQNQFNVLFPSETVDFILAIIKCMWRSLYKDKSKTMLTNRIIITQNLLEFALSAKKGSLNLSN